MNSGESSKPGLFQTIFKPVKDIATSVGKNHYPRWRVDYTTTAFGNTGYSIAIFAVPGDKVFKFVLDVNDPFTDSNLPAYISKNDWFISNSFVFSQTKYNHLNINKRMN